MSLPVNHHLYRLTDLLQAHNDILCTHPNDLDLEVIPSDWLLPTHELLEYYLTGDVRAENEGSSKQLPANLKKLLDSIRTLKIPRLPVIIPPSDTIKLKSTKGMSPKKLHEVQRMVSYIRALADANSWAGLPNAPLHIVDVGAGQGYLTRALANVFPDAQILALDADAGQTSGAESKLGKEKKGTSRAKDQDQHVDAQITHKTALINPPALLNAVDEWVSETTPDEGHRIPVLFVALHACGSLTPDLLRAAMNARGQEKHTWYPCSIVAVGCCYNLMYPGDYPLSSTLQSYPSCQSRPLPSSAYHLAAQIPETWLVPGPGPVSTWKIQDSMQLATKKIVWRAALAHVLASPHARKSSITPDRPNKSGTCEAASDSAKKSAEVPVKWWLDSTNSTTPSDRTSHPPTLDSPSSKPSDSDVKDTTFVRLPAVNRSDPSLQERQVEGVGQTSTAIRLGKLPDSAYLHGWEHFLKTAGKRLGVEWAVGEDNIVADAVSAAGPTLTTLDALRDFTMEKKVETLHVLRCLLGPAVESAILLDRVAWLKEKLENGEHESAEVPWKVELVNLFDQRTGSGRNVAICVAATLPHFESTNAVC